MSDESMWGRLRRWLLRAWDRVTMPYVPTRWHQAQTALYEQEIRYVRQLLDIRGRVLATTDARLRAAESERDALLAEAAALTRRGWALEERCVLPSLANPGPALRLDLAQPVTDSVMSVAEWVALLGGNTTRPELVSTGVIDGDRG